MAFMDSYTDILCILVLFVQSQQIISRRADNETLYVKQLKTESQGIACVGDS